MLRSMPAIIPPNPWKYAVDLYHEFTEAIDARDFEKADRIAQKHAETIAQIELTKLQIEGE